MMGRPALTDLLGLSRSRLGVMPHLFVRELNKRYYRVTNGSFHDDGVDVFAADWDRLVILDACRYDLFESVADLPGRLEQRQSQGSDTIEFLTANLTGRDLRDTVYVTANPQFRKIESRLGVTFHDVIDLWEHGWNKAINTVLPERVTEEVLAVQDRYPNKRLLVHYNQPHIPFIGSTGREQFDLNSITDHPLPFWQQPLAGTWTVDDETIWAAYRENLAETLPHIERLLANVTGKTVVTADHGNMIGDRAFPLPLCEYGHPRGLYTPELVTVPWLTQTNGQRPEITAEDPVTEAADTERIDKRLEHLGYKS